MGEQPAGAQHTQLPILARGERGGQKGDTHTRPQFKKTTSARLSLGFWNFLCLSGYIYATIHHGYKF